MRIASRAKTIAFFITLGASGVGLAIALNITWVIINWKEVVPLVLGIFFFGFIIAGLVLNTIFLVREIRRNEQQDSFLNAVTHELKTPIASIRLYLETLRKRPVEESQRHDFYRIMLEDTDRLLGTVEQVLKAGEARHGTNNKKQQQEVDFSSLVRDSLELARLRHKVTPQELRFGADPDPGIILLGNPEELRTAVGNLLDNAVKYSGKSTEIVVDVLSPNMDTVVLQVRDKGIGIPKPELKRIFKRFYRVRTLTSGPVKGTGLGLLCVPSRGVTEAMYWQRAKAREEAARLRCACPGYIAHEPDPDRRRRSASGPRPAI
jgi:two-component system, OmpR family, sensor histidine kinase SenX3